MSDVLIPLNPGTGAQSADFAQESTSNSLRQVVVLGDPTAKAGEAEVRNTDPVSSTYGIVTRPINSTSNPTFVSGPVSDGGTAAGSPLPVGGIFHASAPTYTDGQRFQLQSDVNGNLKVTLATRIAGEDLTNDVLKVERRALYRQITASTQIKASAGRLRGIFVSAASATPTIKVWDNTAGSGAILIDVFTPVPAQYYGFGDDAVAGTGLFVTISGTVSCTVFYN